MHLILKSNKVKAVKVSLKYLFFVGGGGGRGKAVKVPLNFFFLFLKKILHYIKIDSNLRGEFCPTKIYQH